MKIFKFLIVPKKLNAFLQETGIVVLYIAKLRSLTKSIEKGWRSGFRTESSIVIKDSIWDPKCHLDCDQGFRMGSGTSAFLIDLASDRNFVMNSPSGLTDFR